MKFRCDKRPGILHFNSHEHRANRRDGGDRPTLVFRKTRSGKAILCRDVTFTGTCRLRYTPSRPLKCGAVAYVEILGVVELDGV